MYSLFQKIHCNHHELTHIAPTILHCWLLLLLLLLVA
jgi:hypothetical protein